MSDTGMVSFDKPIAYSRNYPPPLFPAYPVAQYANDRTAPAGTQVTLYAARARYGLALIASSCIKPGSRVLLPAYHCPAMIEPFLWANCKINFYPLSPDLAPRIPDSELAAAEVIVLVRYFGFDAGLAKIADRGRRHGCLVIEDLAHAAYAKSLHGDIAVTSLAKFYGQHFGAELFFRKANTATTVEREIRTRSRSRLRWSLHRFAKRLTSKLNQYAGPKKAQGTGYRYFNENELHRPTSHCKVKRAKPRKTVSDGTTRQTNYRRLLSISENSALGKALYPQLPDDTIPCVFPFLLHQAETFDLIRKAGIPLFRWEELASMNCAISRDYRSRLIQIPCHQDMTPNDFRLIEQSLTNLAKESYP